MDLTLLNASAERLVALLRESESRIVLAESCSCGLAAAALGQIPGVSHFFCGTFVTYRNSAKTEWLQVDPQAIEQHTATSLETSGRMARQALSSTSEANLAAAITGHLGPDSTDNLDGQVFVVVCESRSGESVERSFVHQLRTESRAARQFESVELFLEDICSFLKERTD